jgi:toxin ParE1/3/4
VPYLLTKEAARDIRNIYAKGRLRFGQGQAHRYHLHLKTVFEAIADNPFMAHERAEISPPVRIHPSGSHLIVYIIGPRNEVVIVAVRHYREDWKPRGR